MRVLASIFALSVVTLGVSVHPSCSPGAGGLTPHPVVAPPRVECATPARLHLRRFEDGSAWLRCGPLVLARVSVPR